MGFTICTFISFALALYDIGKKNVEQIPLTAVNLSNCLHTCTGHWTSI